MSKYDIVEIAVRVLGLVLIGIAIATSWRVVYYLISGPPPLQDAEGKLSYYVHLEGVSPLFHPQLPVMVYHLVVCTVSGIVFARFAPWVTRRVLGSQARIVDEHEALPEHSR